MRDLYQSPRDGKRFEQYLQMLQGDSGDDMVLPIAAYNPMGGELVLNKLNELKNNKAEQLAIEVCKAINHKIDSRNGGTYQVVINVCDDVSGAWSHRYTTDFAARFDLSAFVKRKFSTPYFWTSENYDETLIVRRLKEAIYRTMYWTHHGKPITLQDHMKQELAVLESCEVPDLCRDLESETIASYYQKYKTSEDQSRIFNFFYGDVVSDSLGYQTYGISDRGGLQYLEYLCQNEKTII